MKRKANTRQRPSAQSGGSKSDQNRQGAPPHTTPLNRPNTEDNQGKEREHPLKPTRLDWVRFAIEVVTLLVLGRYTIAQIEQTRLLQATNVATNRASIIVEIGTIGGPAEPGKPSPGITIEQRYGNSGNTATKEYIAYHQCIVTDRAFADPWTQMDRSGRPQPGVIGPKQIIRNICGLGYDDTIAVGQGRKFYYALFDLYYRDQIDPTIQHRTEAEFQIQPLGAEMPGGPNNTNVTVVTGALIKTVGFHNCADDGCPKDDEDHSP